MLKRFVSAFREKLFQNFTVYHFFIDLYIVQYREKVDHYHPTRDFTGPFLNTSFLCRIQIWMSIGAERGLFRDKGGFVQKLGYSELQKTTQREIFKRLILGVELEKKVGSVGECFFEIRKFCPKLGCSL